MSAQWRSKEFSCMENIVGHGRERVAKEMVDFLNNNRVIPGNCFGSIFIDDSSPGQKDAEACGILFYYK